jgi:hypothetical protein
MKLENEHQDTYDETLFYTNRIYFSHNLSYRNMK